MTKKPCKIVGFYAFILQWNILRKHALAKDNCSLTLLSTLEIDGSIPVLNPGAGIDPAEGQQTLVTWVSNRTKSNL